MPPLDFPSPPTDGQIFNAAGVSWMWDGTKWTSVLSAGGPFLPLAGGDMTGPLNYVATGGTAERSAQDRSAHTINVKDFGAKGDGIDDTVAIQAALNAIPVSGGAVWFPVGTYNLTSTLVIPITGLSPNGTWSGIKLYGDGAGFTRFTHNLRTAPFVTCTVPSGQAKFNLTIQDMAFQTYDVAFNAWHIDVQNVHSFTLRRCDLWSQNATQSAIGGVRVRSVGAGSIFYARIENCMLIGGTVEFDTITDSWIEGSILQCINAGNDGGRASSIHLTGAQGGDIKITNNHIYSANSGGIFCDATGHAIMVVEGNMFDTNPPNPTTAIGINIASAGKLWTITNNVFNAIPATTIQAWDLSNSTMANNMFVGCGTGSGTAPTITFNATATGCQSVAVSGNAARNDSTIATPLYFVRENAFGANNNVYLANSILGVGYQAVPYQLYGGSTPVLHLPAGLGFGLRDAASLTDLTQHIAVIDGYKGFNATAAGLGYVSDTAHVFVVNGAQVGFINSTGLNSMAIGQQSPVVGTFSVVQVQSTTGPTWSSGSAAPAATQPVGSIYSRVGGAVGSTLYVSRGGGTWAAVAGV